MRRILVLLLLLATAATAQVNETVEAADDLANNATNGLGDLLEGVGDATEAVGEGVGNSAKGIGDTFSAVFRSVGKAIDATMEGLGIAGAATAAGLGTAFLWTMKGLGTVLEGTGFVSAFLIEGAAIGLGKAFIAAASLIATINSAYWSLVSNLRPEGMPFEAYAAMTYTGVGATSSAAAWGGWQLLRKWGIAGPIGIAGFTRIQNDQLLEHPVRQQLFDTISGQPGIHASELAREVGIGWGTVSHHLQKLEKGRMIATRKVNNQRCYFQNGGSVGSTDMEVVSAVKGDKAGLIAQFVHHHPMTSQKQMCEGLDISPALASFHVKKLVNLGVLERVRHGKASLLTTSQAMRRVMEADASIEASWAAQQDEGLQYRA